MLADIRPNEEHAKEHIERNPVTTVAQVVPEMSEHEVRSGSALHDAKDHMLLCRWSNPTQQEVCAHNTCVISSLFAECLRPVCILVQVNTTAVVFATKSMNHVEGGWPKEVDYTEAEHVIRYRKKVGQGHYRPCLSYSPLLPAAYDFH